MNHIITSNLTHTAVTNYNFRHFLRLSTVKMFPNLTNQPLFSISASQMHLQRKLNLNPISPLLPLRYFTFSFYTTPLSHPHPTELM